MRITLPNHKAISWNQIYSSGHWIKRKQLADKVHADVWSAHRNPGPPWSAFNAVVDIIITAYFKNRPVDSDNICSKLYIDGLKGWLLKDDTPEYVRSVTTKSVVEGTEPRLEIEISEA